MDKQKLTPKQLKQMEKFLQKRFPTECITVQPYPDPKMEWKIIMQLTNHSVQEIKDAVTEWYGGNTETAPVFVRLHYDD